MSVFDAARWTFVKTCPCPRCRSERTEASLYSGAVVARSCFACCWVWDRANGEPACEEDLGRTHVTRVTGRTTPVIQNGTRR